MTDRELLEAAAKAAGIEYRPAVSARVVGMGVTGSPHLRSWNPLTDDGDALRLAVKLKLEIDIINNGIAARTQRGEKILVDAKEEACAYAATRRAIVRAAASLAPKETT